ncbi:ACP S-malonyltransferase [bacterium CPR1]|nr:ACP S-malonyltransferase [bacterium CPR1]
MPVALLFPGQNSRYPAMFDHLLAWDRRNLAILEQASGVLGRDLKRHFRSDNPNVFRRNRDVQLGVFLANHMHWQNLQRQGLEAEYSAGLSLGEFNHLVHIGALDFEEALRILQVRGLAYEEGPEGVMTAVFPVGPEEVEELLERTRTDGQVGIGMYNTPRQCVLSGQADLVERLALQAEEEFYAQSRVIEERLPMHSPRFRSTGEVLRPALEAACWRTPERPYLPNLTGEFLAEPDRVGFIDCLSRHTWNPVRWRESMECLSRQEKDLIFVETGPKSVLTDFFGRKWLDPKRYTTDSEGDFGASMATLVEELLSGPTGAAFHR